MNSLENIIPNYGRLPTIPEKMNMIFWINVTSHTNRRNKLQQNRELLSYWKNFVTTILKKHFVFKRSFNFPQRFPVESKRGWRINKSGISKKRIDRFNIKHTIFTVSPSNIILRIPIFRKGDAFNHVTNMVRKVLFYSICIPSAISNYIPNKPMANRVRNVFGY